MATGHWNQSAMVQDCLLQPREWQRDEFVCHKPLIGGKELVLQKVATEVKREEIESGLCGQLNRRSIAD